MALSKGRVLKAAWSLALPFWTGDEKWSARALLAAVVALNLTAVWLNVRLNAWNNDFYNALQEYDWPKFWWQFAIFGMIAASLIVVAVYQLYLRQILQIRWRRWMTERFLHAWLGDQTYYRMQLDQSATDNPDQRIAEDLRDFCHMSLSLTLDLLSNIVSLCSFVTILWGLSGAIEAFGIPIPGYMVWVALAYAVVGTLLTHLVGRPLSILNFRQQRVEADFRYALVRIRENVESIALYRGEQEEGVTLSTRFGAVIDNWYQIMRRTKLLNSLINGYSQIAVIFPIVVAAPRYFSGAMQLGGLMQTVGAFGQVQSSMSWFVDSYASIAQWRAIVERLSTFHRAIVKARAETHGGFITSKGGPGIVDLRDVTMSLPDGTKLLDHADVTFTAGHSVVITGRTGSGKSTLFRVLAGIWPYGKGEVKLPPNSFFLPQRPYIPLGTLRHVITYPNAVDAFATSDIAQALTDAGLPQLCDRIERDDNWPMRLSGGEQQRIALARALLAKPDWIFLDEATASLDPDAEEDMYQILKQRLPNATLVSIAHRPSVAAFHDSNLIFKRDEGSAGTLAPAATAPAIGD
jgi:vitamin B12/bleomycin/antimicrobial peptide transport system ATP-binding/permease protein